MAFYLKKFISFFCEPLTICFILFAIGLYYLYKKECNLRRARIFLTAGVAALFIFSCSALNHPFIGWLESSFQPCKNPPAEQQYKYIFVLGHGHEDNEKLPATSSLSDEGLARVVEGVRLHRLIPDSKLIFSGWGGDQEVSYAEMAQAAAVELGVNPQQIRVIPKVRDTIEEAQAASELLGEDATLLVTSANHMPRSFGLFKKQGINVTAAPCFFINKGEWQFSLPSSGGLYRSEKVIYETMGRLWAWLTGRT